jgi:hypothetical protein
LRLFVLGQLAVETCTGRADELLLARAGTETCLQAELRTLQDPSDIVPLWTDSHWGSAACERPSRLPDIGEMGRSCGAVQCSGVLALADKSASRLHGYWHWAVWDNANGQGQEGLMLRLSACPLRFKMLFFYAYLSVVQLLQFRYQMSRLYALRALSRVHPMETTNELGQQNVIHHRGLGFLLPWLGGAYVLEFALGWTWLWMGAGRSGEDVHWEATVVGVLMLVMAVGNTLTTLYTFFRKMKPSPFQIDGHGRDKSS